MPKMIVAIGGVVIREVQLTKDRTSLGRRPYNDIVIDDLAVSREHAVLRMSGAEVHVEDLNSTNGTCVNGKTVTKQLLQNNDRLELGRYTITFIHEAAAAGPKASIKVMSGVATGREVALVKLVTTLGKPGVAVASITKKPHGFVIAHVEGVNTPLLNGSPIGTKPVTLKNADLLELAGTQMQFVQH